MLINTKDIRPQNESEEHFFLKQVGRAYLFRQGIRCIATEVCDMDGEDNPPFGTKKRIIDVVGLDRRDKPNKLAGKLLEKIRKHALLLGKKEKLTIMNRFGDEEFPNPYAIQDAEEKLAMENAIRLCHEEACEAYGYHRRLYKQLRWFREETFELRGIEVKVSHSDFKNGFSMLPEYSYILAPIGIVPKEELPKKVGLLEFDFDKYHRRVEKGEKDAWFSALQMTKRPKKTYDAQFTEEKNGKRYTNQLKHTEFCQQLLFQIAQQNSEEHVFWNPHLFQETPPVFSGRMKERFLLDIGQDTPFGRVAERKVGSYTCSMEEFNRLPKRYGYVVDKKIPYMPYYRFLTKDGLSKWIADIEVDVRMQQERYVMTKQLHTCTTLSSLLEWYTTAFTKGFALVYTENKQEVSLDDFEKHMSDLPAFFQRTTVSLQEKNEEN